MPPRPRSNCLQLHLVTLKLGMHWDMPKPSLCAKAHGMSSCLHCALALPHQTLSHTAAFNRKTPANGPENGHALGHGQAKAVCQSSRHQPLTSHRTVNGRRTLGRHAIVFGRMLSPHGSQSVCMHWAMLMPCDMAKAQSLTPSLGPTSDCQRYHKLAHRYS